VEEEEDDNTLLIAFGIRTTSWLCLAMAAPLLPALVLPTMVVLAHQTATAWAARDGHYIVIQLHSSICLSAIQENNFINDTNKEKQQFKNTNYTKTNTS
jgi:hypothetical protein